jgi:competence protein ComFC
MWHVKLIGGIKFLAEAFLQLICEERCRVCGILLGIAQHIFVCGEEEFAEASPALLYAMDSCGKRIRFSNTLCQRCWNELNKAPPLLGFCQITAGDNPTSLPIASGAPYAGKLRKLIHRFKFENDRRLNADLAAIALSSWPLLTNFVREGECIVVPVPLYWRRRLERGFNQAELVSQLIAEQISAPLAVNALKRSKSTVPQKRLNQHERTTNVANAFTANQRQIDGKVVILVDDICTSGATLVSCARVLLQGGAKAVVAMTVARAIMRSSSALRMVPAQREQCVAVQDKIADPCCNRLSD